MHPVLCQVGPLTVYLYGLFVALGLFVGFTLAIRQAKKQGFAPQVILDVGFYTVLAGIIGSRIFYVVQNFSFYQDNLLAIFKVWEGGLVFQGGVLFALPVGWFLLKKNNLSFWHTFDLLAPSMAIGQAFGRIGCFFAGCCYGKPTDLPWGVTFTDPKTLAVPDIPLHPTQLYSSAGLFFIFLVLIAFRNRTRFPGQLACFYLILHSCLRFLVEFFRNDPRGYLYGQISLPQGICILTFSVALVCYLYLHRQQSVKRIKN